MLLAILCMVALTFAQSQNPEKQDSCNVVCNCNTDPSSRHEIDEVPISQGQPGKRGSKGELGPIGPKGAKGNVGIKGQKGNDADGVLISNILGALSAESCDELRHRHQVTTSGYYLLRNRRKPSPNYVYCDFTEYTDVSTCKNLTKRYNITMEGYYLFGMTRDETRQFQFCSPVFQGIYTCQRLQELYKVRESGFYKFQSQDMEPFRVYCHFSNNPAVTEVHHNLMGERRSDTTCEDAFCYSVNPDYGVTGSDLGKIVENSITCKQFIKIKCRGVQIRNYAKWMSRTGEAMTYWGGASIAGYCACGEAGTCIRKTDKCNCDQNSASVVTSDEGYLSDKSKLPVSQIQLGDMGAFSEESWYTLGKLECIGQR